jgi:hypothetical protein
MPENKFRVVRRVKRQDGLSHVAPIDIQYGCLGKEKGPRLYHPE